ncbi:sulfotransferase family protein [Stakelama tenebrarum]|uniref:Sulfotransferase n=1 Tax=Stakelama tenebrarum TaxID=2711215 RepID=A0A6G6Y6V8_9SPHN|nr:sulfotransferase [Sphingosinithalassobacter tenebrarum]QIG80650.1 sulfotransferase [Sphingosinithalassobacter tenebrarum]
MDRAAQLLEKAKQAAGCDDFGDDGFREGLDRLLHALDTEARLNARGRMGMEFQIVDILTKRLQVVDWYVRHPETEDQEIVAPLIGLGLPRTASTALACMLGEDGTTRSLRTWESMAPCPPPDPATEMNDPRLAQAEAAMARRAKAHPRLTAMLPTTATSPTECQLFMAHDFKSQMFEAFVHVPGYIRWLIHEADLVPTYAHVKRVLKLLQYHGPVRPWRLKNPSHSLFIDALNQVFPDARFVMTHRPPQDVIPSVSDLHLEYHGSFTDDIDRHAIGAGVVDFCETAMERMIAFRDAGQDHRFCDIHFADFQADPMREIARLYAFLGEELTAETRAAMLAWRAAQPIEAAQYDRTDPAEFGLDRDAIAQRFAFYTNRFAPEGQAA